MKFPSIALTLATLFAVMASHTLAAEVYDAADRSQVFIDKVLVAAESGVTFTLHPAETRRQPEGYTGPWSHHDSAQAPFTTQIIRGENGLFESWTWNGAHKTSATGLEWTSPPMAGDASWARNYPVWFSVFRDELATACRRMEECDPSRFARRKACDVAFQDAERIAVYVRILVKSHSAKTSDRSQSGSRLTHNT